MRRMAGWNTDLHLLIGAFAMGKSYRPGVWSKRYQNLSPAKRDEVNKKVNKIFVDRTGFEAKLDPERHKDLVRVWLHIRDEVMSGRAKRTPRTFLWLEGIEGASKDPKHRGWIDLVSVRPILKSSGAVRAPYEVVVDRHAHPDDVRAMLSVAGGSALRSSIIHIVRSDNVFVAKMKLVVIREQGGVGRSFKFMLRYESISWDFK